MWKYTRAFLSKFRQSFSSLLAAITVFFLGVAAVQKGGVLIDYYCSASSPSIFGFYIKDYLLCPAYSLAYFIFGTTFFVMAGWLLIVVLADSFLLTKQKAAIYSKRERRAKFLFVKVLLEQKGMIEIYIAICNEEFWLNAKSVYAETGFIFLNPYRPIEGRIKWDNSKSHEGETDIKRKSYKTLHFATVDPVSENFTLHKINGDEVFPKFENTCYFPVRICGDMFFGEKLIKKVALNSGFEVLVDYKGKKDLSVNIKRKY